MPKLWWILILSLGVGALDPTARAADVVVLGEAQLKPVAEVISAVRGSLPASTVVPPAEVRGKLSALVRAERARVVVALGKTAVQEALTLPSSIAVVYGLVVTPVETSRPNTAGVFMATPLREYCALIEEHFPEMKKVLVLGNEPALIRAMGPACRSVRVSYTLAEVPSLGALQEGNDRNAVLLSPNPAVLSEVFVNELFRFSFRTHTPVLGVSEREVKLGALAALVFDARALGEQLAELVDQITRTGRFVRETGVPCRKFNLFLNLETARQMSIRVPEGAARKALRTYPE